MWIYISLNYVLIQEQVVVYMVYIDSISSFHIIYIYRYIIRTQYISYTI